MQEKWLQTQKFVRAHVLKNELPPTKSLKLLTTLPTRIYYVFIAGSRLNGIFTTEGFAILKNFTFDWGEA